MIIDAIIKRRSIRDYKSESVPPALLEEIIKAAQFAPTSRGNRAVEFIVVTDKKLKEKILAITPPPKQDFILNAPLLIIPVTDTTKTTNAIQDLSLATAHILLQATALGLGGVWKNIRPQATREIMKLLKIPKNFWLINLIPIGYPASQLESHQDSEFDNKKIHYNFW